MPDCIGNAGRGAAALLTAFAAETTPENAVALLRTAREQISMGLTGF